MHEVLSLIPSITQTAQVAHAYRRRDRRTRKFKVILGYMGNTSQLRIHETLVKKKEEKEVDKGKMVLMVGKVDEKERGK